MYEKAKNYTLLRPRLKKTVGIFLVLLGFVGIILPVMPGAVFVFIGLEFLGLRFLFIDRLLKRKAPEAVIVEQTVV
jgi:uncharacterized membrane protein YbaN (DUF454 family)